MCVTGLSLWQVCVCYINNTYWFVSVAGVCVLYLQYLLVCLCGRCMCVIFTILTGLSLWQVYVCYIYNTYWFVSVTGVCVVCCPSL